MLRGSCLCGTVTYEISGHVGEVVVGTLDDYPGMTPQEHIFVGSKAPWYEISDALPQHREWPPDVEA